VLGPQVSTNQRVYFDVSACGQYVVSGGTDANVRVWDLKSSPSQDHEDPIVEPLWIGPQGPILWNSHFGLKISENFHPQILDTVSTQKYPI
jgi:WD40 repeat protein